MRRSWSISRKTARVNSLRRESPQPQIDPVSTQPGMLAVASRTFATRTAGSFFTWNITDQLKEIQAPTLVIAGEEDQATTVEVNQVLADNIPNATLKVVPEVGHFYQQESPIDFNNDLRSFLKQLEG